MEEPKILRFDEAGKVYRVFTEEWKNSGLINTDKLPDLMRSIISQKHEMVKYIEMLHDTIDAIIEKNGICEACLESNCTSDHK